MQQFVEKMFSQNNGIQHKMQIFFFGAELIQELECADIALSLHLFITNIKLNVTL